MVEHQVLLFFSTRQESENYMSFGVEKSKSLESNTEKRKTERT